MTQAKPYRAFDIEAVRADFPVLGRQVRGQPLVYLDSAASAQKPKPVIDCLRQYYGEQHANVHRGVHYMSQEATRAYEQARERVRGFINARHEYEVLFTRGTTEAINLAASSFGRQFLTPGDEVILSTMEHHSNIVPWQMICEQQGASIKVVPINHAGELDLDVYVSLLGERTRLVALSHVSNALGTINPIETIIAEARRREIPVLLDGAQAVAHIAVDVQALDVDFYALSAHKVFGPTGIGILYGKESLLNQMPPYQGGGDMIERVTFERTTYNTLPHKFEAGTPNIADGIAFGVALEYLQQFQLDEIHAHEQALLTYATDELLAIDGVEIIGVAENKASVISFNLKGAHPFDVGTILDQLGVAVRTGHHCCQPLMDFYGIPGTVRASLAMYNNRHDVEALVQGVKRAARMLL